MTKNRDVLDLLREANTVPDATLPDEHAFTAAGPDTNDATVDELDQARRRRAPRRRTVLAAAAVTVVAGAGLVVVDPFSTAPGAIATAPLLSPRETAPGVPGRAGLEALAAVAAKDTSLPGDTGGQHVVRTRAWNMENRVDGKQIRTVILPQEIRLEWNADLSGTKTVTTGTPLFTSEASRQAWRNDGVRRFFVGQPEDHLTWAKGEYRPAMVYPLPTDPQRLLAAFIAAGAPVDVDGTGQLTDALAGVYRETTPPPAGRAAMLRLLATRTDMISLGQLTDRAGRTGAAFAIDTTYTGAQRRHVLIFNPATGTLLAEEDVLLGKIAKLDVPYPSVIGYTLYTPPTA